MTKSSPPHPPFDAFTLPCASEASAALAARFTPSLTSRPGAPAVLYLHGFGSSQGGEKAGFFRQVFADAGLGFLSLDFRGHGESSGGMEGLTLGRCVEDARAGLVELARRGYERAVVVGSSMGGRVALELAAEGDEAGEASLAAVLGIAPAVDMLERTETRAGAEGLAHWQSEGVVEVTTEVVSCSLGWGFVEDLRSRALGVLARRLSVPTLLLHGKNDDTVSWRAVADFAVAGDGALELVLFADGDHRLLAHKPRLGRLMLGFLEDRGVLSPLGS